MPGEGEEEMRQLFLPHFFKIAPKTVRRGQGRGGSPLPLIRRSVQTAPNLTEKNFQCNLTAGGETTVSAPEETSRPTIYLHPRAK